MAARTRTLARTLAGTVPRVTGSRLFPRLAFSTAVHTRPKAVISTSTSAAPSVLAARVPALSRAASTAASMNATAPNLPPIPNTPRITVSPPDLAAIRASGEFDDDVALLGEGKAVLNITPEAIQQLARLAASEPPDSQLALRVGVDSGGCHGYQYTMDLTEERGVDDYAFRPADISAIPVLVDLMSLGLLKGSTLHYATELIGSSFRLQDNPQAKQGGNCGCGVSWEARDDLDV